MRVCEFGNLTHSRQLEAYVMSCDLFESLDVLRLLSNLGDSVLGNLEESPMIPRELEWPITWHSNTLGNTVLEP